jgi:Lrp/AsnC family leucine-responsive transcriptional regulator
MIGHDIKDRKILYQLDLNCRQSNAQIGKKVGLSRKVVEYRIRKMEEEEVIKNYYTVIDAYKLGYLFYRFYINLQTISKKKKQELIEHFVNYKKISTVATIKGIYDLVIVFWVNDIAEFYDFWKECLKQYGTLFSERHFSLYIHGRGYPLSFLLYDDMDKVKPVQVDSFGITNNIKIDKVDYKLLNEIALKARITSVDLSNVLGCSSQNVIYRMNKLENYGLIQSFRTAVDFSIFGFKYYKVNIQLKDYNKRTEIVNQLEQSPFINYYSSTLGLCDLEFEFIVRDADHLIDIIDGISDRFPDSIRNYDYYSDIINYKESFLPELTEKDFRKT